jgi:hypothetical protein
LPGNVRFPLSIGNQTIARISSLPILSISQHQTHRRTADRFLLQVGQLEVDLKLYCLCVRQQ